MKLNICLMYDIPAEFETIIIFDSQYCVINLTNNEKPMFKDLLTQVNQIYEKNAKDDIKYTIEFIDKDLKNIKNTAYSEIELLKDKNTLENLPLNKVRGNTDISEINFQSGSILNVKYVDFGKLMSIKPYPKSSISSISNMTLFDAMDKISGKLKAGTCLKEYWMGQKDKNKEIETGLVFKYEIPVK